MPADRLRVALYRAVPLPARLKDRLAWALSPRVRLGVHAVIGNERGDVLMLRPTYAPGWQLPGGMVEAHETLDAAIRREIGEELGTAAHDLERVAWHYDPVGRDVRALYRATIDPAQIRLGPEHSRWCFCAPEELPAHLAHVVRLALAQR